MNTRLAAGESRGQQAPAMHCQAPLLKYFGVQLSTFYISCGHHWPGNKTTSSWKALVQRISHTVKIEENVQKIEVNEWYLIFLGLLSRGEGDKEASEDTDTEAEDEPRVETAEGRVKSGSSSSCSTGLLSPPDPGDMTSPSSSVQQQTSVAVKSKQESSSGSSKQESSTSACSSWSSIASSRQSTACVTTDL